MPHERSKPTKEQKIDLEVLTTLVVISEFEIG